MKEFSKNPLPLGLVAVVAPNRRPATWASRESDFSDVPVPRVLRGYMLAEVLLVVGKSDR
jgi:hypothetical protein